MMGPENWAEEGSQNLGTQGVGGGERPQITVT